MCVFVSLLVCILLCVRKTDEQPELPIRSSVAQRYVQHSPSSPCHTEKGITKPFTLP